MNGENNVKGIDREDLVKKLEKIKSLSLDLAERDIPYLKNKMVLILGMVNELLLLFDTKVPVQGGDYLVQEKKRIPVRENLFSFPSLPGNKPHLIGSRCKNCGEYFFPFRGFCPRCFKEGGMESVPLSSRGILYTFGVVERAPLGFTAPYAVGYVDLPEGIRIYSLLTGIELKGLRIGMEMELVVDVIREDQAGNEIIGYKFRPVSTGG